VKSSLQHNCLTAGAAFLLAGALALGVAQSARLFRNVTRAAARSHTAIPGSPWARDLTFLRPGDLIFRRGESLLSDAVMVLDNKSRYSHVGIVTQAVGTLLVVHAVVGEAPETAGSVRADSIRVFLAPEHAVAAAVYRLRENSPASTAAAELASRIAAGYAARHVPFDPDFDLDTADSMYCTELVWRAYRGAGVELVSGDFPTISFCLKRRKAILPSTLQNSVKLRLVWQKEESD
jgi:Permuted papain-like amidase enzyme, YaeF/YiiX, C92 family